MEKLKLDKGEPEKVKELWLAHQKPVFQSERVGLIRSGAQIQYLMLDPQTNEAILMIHRGWPNSFSDEPIYSSTEATLIGELKFTGFLRRVKLLKQLVECSPEEIQPGDRAVLVDEGDSVIQITTLPLKPYEPATLNDNHTQETASQI